MIGMNLCGSHKNEYTRYKSILYDLEIQSMSNFMGLWCVMNLLLK